MTIIQKINIIIKKKYNFLSLLDAKALKIQKFNPGEKLIENLMLKTIAHVEPVVSVLKKRLAILNKGLVLDRECLDMVKSIHLTVSQRNQFKSLCRRFDAMGREDELKSILNCSRITSDQLLKKLTEKLAKQAL